MKWSHGIGLGSVLLAIGTASWVGCGGDDTTATPGGDAGTDAVSADSGGGTDSGGSTDGGGGSDTGADAGLSCEVYCTQVTENCKSTGTFPPDKADVDGGNQQYVTKQGCLNECAKTPVGSITDTAGDTLGCRQYHSGAAKVDPKLHCPHAGPSGGGVCSGGDGGAESRCYTFCARALSLCTVEAGVPQGDVPFTDLADCTSKCNNNPFKFDSTKQELLNNGNNLNCRQYHLEAAYENPPGTAATHCPHLKTGSATCN
ncbi:MAG: hypothetical protein JWM74_5722 [Myxococcaceae bacterium]|jgi:hypothetical protein|nr:hypothetical protein [Myxococcaceae bacterium]